MRGCWLIGHISTSSVSGASLDPRENMGTHCLQPRTENCADHLQAIPDLLHNGRDGWLRMPLAMAGERHLSGVETVHRKDRTGQDKRAEMR